MSFKLPFNSGSFFRAPSSTRITFESWDEGGIFDWYRDLHHTSVQKLELRKEKEGVRHEFILVHTDGGLVYRIDRRALGGVTPEAIASEGCEAEDTIVQISPRDLLTVNSITEAEVVMEFLENKPDFYLLIAICVTILMDPKSKHYTLMYYNCYFLSRSLMAITLRHCLLPHPPPTSPSPLEGIRWDLAVVPTLSEEEKYDWSKLRDAVKGAAIRATTSSIGTIITTYADSRIKKQEELPDVVSAVISEAVTKNVEDLIGDEQLIAVYKEALATAEQTLWRESLGQNLAVPMYRGKCEGVVDKILLALSTANQEKSGIIEGIAARIEDPVKRAYFALPEQEEDVTHTDSLQRAVTRAIPGPALSLAKKLARDSQVPKNLIRSISENVPRSVAGMLPREVSRHLSLDTRGQIKLLRTKIYEALSNWSLKNEIAENILSEILQKSEGELPQSIRIHIRKEKRYEEVSTHAGLQYHILDMTRKHGKMVALSKLKLTEESAYNDLYRKTEEIWRAVRPRSVPSPRLKKTIYRITDAVKEGMHHTMHVVDTTYKTSIVGDAA